MGLGGGMFGSTSAVGRVFVELVGNNTQLLKTVEESKVAVAGGTGEMSAATAGMGTATKIGLGVAAFAFADFVKTGFQRLAEWQKINAQTAAVVRSTGGAANMSAKDVHAYAESLQQSTTIQAEVIQGGENMLLTFTAIRNEVGAGNDIFNQATSILLDMSTALGEDTTHAAIQLGKALQDPVRGVTALRRVGVAFTVEQVAQISALVKSNNLLGAQKIILHELNTEFGGSAKALGGTLIGQWHLFGEEVGKLSEDFVRQLMPAIQSFLESAVQVAQSLGPVITVGGQVLAWTLSLFAALERINPALGILAVWLLVWAVRNRAVLLSQTALNMELAVSGPLLFENAAGAEALAAAQGGAAASSLALKGGLMSTLASSGLLIPVTIGVVGAMAAAAYTARDYKHAVETMKAALDSGKVSQEDLTKSINAAPVPAWAKDSLRKALKEAAGGTDDLTASNAANALSEKQVAEATKQADEARQKEAQHLAGFQRSVDGYFHALGASSDEWAARNGRNLRDASNLASLAGESFQKFRTDLAAALAGDETDWAKWKAATLASLADWRRQAEERFNGVAASLQDLSTETHLSAQKILKAFDDQLVVMARYQTDWDVVAKRAGTNADSLLASLQGMGLGGASVVHALATANKDEFDKIVGDWNKGGAKAHSLAGDIQTTLVGAIDRLIAALKGIPGYHETRIDVDTSQAEREIADWNSKMRAFGIQITVGGSNAGAIHGGGAHAGTWVPGYGGGDKHIYALEGGEAVIPKESASAHRDLISWLISEGRGMQVGGIAGLSHAAGLAASAAALLGSFRGSTTLGLHGLDAAMTAGKGMPGTPSAVRTWLAQALMLTGHPIPPYIGAEEIIAMRESGGNPRASNPAPPYAKGLMQTILGTFLAWALPGHRNIFDPVDNAAASIGYQFGRYGNPNQVPGVLSVRAGGGYRPYGDGGFGVFDSPTLLSLLVGERGREGVAIVPDGGVPHGRLGPLPAAVGPGSGEVVNELRGLRADLRKLELQVTSVTKVDSDVTDWHRERRRILRG